MTVAQAPGKSHSPLTIDAHRHARFGAWLIVAGLAGLLAWASLAPLDQGVSVVGKVVVAGHRQAVQHPTGGVIERIAVREGDLVDAGQLLLQLDATQTQAQRQMLYVQHVNTRANAARLQAELQGRADIDFDPALLDEATSPWARETLQQQRQLLIQRQQALRLEQAAQRQNLAAVQAALSGQRRSLVHLKAERAALAEQLQGLRELAQEGYVAHNRLLEHERTYSQLGANLAQAEGNLAVTARQMLELQLRIDQRQAEYRRDLSHQSSEHHALAEELANRLRSADYELAHTRIVAPASGIVVDLRVFTKGGVINPGQPLMEIVPQDQPLLVDAQAPVELVDKLRPGLPVELMFTAFNQSRTPRIAGELLLVSADRLIDETTAQPYYRIRVRVTEDGLRQLAGQHIRPGMPVQALVRTGERSLLNYLFKPLGDRLHLALVEE